MSAQDQLQIICCQATFRTAEWTDQKQQAVYAKQNALDHEFDQLREKSSGLPFWDSLFWDRDACTISDWALVDAWYRSRCLELPTIGDAMVPCVDMANHSNDPDAYYDEDSEGDVEILLRPGFTVKTGDEVSITYGKFKSAAEMLFSYGFIDPSSSSKDEMTLAVESFPDDPLAQAKVHMFGGLPTVRLSRTDGKLTWESAFLHFMVLNEEDGLDFRILQDNDGGRELRLFWQEEDVTGRAQDFETITKDHPHSLLFRLRAVTVLAQQLSNQLDRIRSVPEGTTGVRKACVEFSKVLKDIEGSLLEDTLSSLEKEVSCLLVLPFSASCLMSKRWPRAGPWTLPQTSCADHEIGHIADQYPNSKQHCSPMMASRQSSGQWKLPKMTNSSPPPHPMRGRVTTSVKVQDGNRQTLSNVIIATHSVLYEYNSKYNLRKCKPDQAAATYIARCKY